MFTREDLAAEGRVMYGILTYMANAYKLLKCRQWKYPDHCEGYPAYDIQSGI